MGEGEGRMRLQVTSHPVTTPGGLSRILSTGPMLSSTRVYPPTLNVAYLRANRTDLLRLAALFRLAATSAHSAIHVPVPPATEPISASHIDIPALALLIARTDTGLRPSDWPTLRHRMRRTSTPLTLTAPPPRSPDRPDDIIRLADRHPAHFTNHAATIIITARPEVLFWMGDWLTAVGDRVADNRQFRKHGESFLGDMAGFFDPKRTDDPMHAFCVVAVRGG